MFALNLCLPHFNSNKCTVRHTVTLFTQLVQTWPSDTLPLLHTSFLSFFKLYKAMCLQLQGSYAIQHKDSDIHQQMNHNNDLFIFYYCSILHLTTTSHTTIPATSLWEEHLSVHPSVCLSIIKEGDMMQLLRIRWGKICVVKKKLITGTVDLL